jgi:ABC-type tungstate transport system permease subunit
MADLHDIIAFSSEGEKILGVVIKHYANSLDDFYVIYADYALHKASNLEEDASVIIDNVIIPACDAAIADYKLKKQQLTDLNKARQDMESLIEAIKSKIDIGNIFDNNLL